MSWCSAVGCTTRTRNEEVKATELSFHRFPRCPEMRREWIKVVGRANWEPKKNSRLCSKHFDKSCYISSSILNTNAVPTIFVENPLAAKKRKPYKRRDKNQSNTPPKKKRKQESGVKTEDAPTKREAKILRSLEKLQTVASRRLKTVRKLRESKRRLEKKNQKLLYLLNHLKSQIAPGAEPLDWLAGAGDETQDSKSSVQTSTRLDVDCTKIKPAIDLAGPKPTPRNNKSVSLLTATDVKKYALTVPTNAPSQVQDVDSYYEINIKTNVGFKSDVCVSEESSFELSSENDNVEDKVEAKAVHKEENAEAEAADEIFEAADFMSLDEEQPEKATLVVGEEGEMCVEVVREGEVTTEPPVTQLYMNRVMMLELRNREKMSPKFVLSQHKCSTCILTFDSNQILKEHDDSFHVPRAGTRACGVCASYVETARLSVHKREHSAYYKCRLCHYHDLSYSKTIAHGKERRHMQTHAATFRQNVSLQAQSAGIRLKLKTKQTNKEHATEESFH